MTTSRITRGLRLARVAAHFANGAVVAGAGYPFMNTAQRGVSLRRWSAQLVSHLAANLKVHGTPPPAPYFLAANHVSWLDIFAINAATPTRFVAKSEVREWPLVGWLCVKADTLFIERARPRDLSRIDAMIADALRAGAGMGVFLEGTTTNGHEVLPFKSSLLRPAQALGVPVTPVAIRYLRKDGSVCTEAAYDGDKSAMDTLRGMLTQREIDVHVHFLPPLDSGGMHHKVLAREAREAIVKVLYS